MPHYTINAGEIHYSHSSVLPIIKYFERMCHSPGGNNLTVERISALHIGFNNTNIYFCASGYSEVEGDFEVVSHDDFEYLVSTSGFLDAGSLRPLEFLPLQISAETISRSSFTRPCPSVAVIVPIYGSPQYTSDVRREIEAFLSELRLLNGRVVISVDGHKRSDHTHSHLSLLEGLDSAMVEVHAHEENLGFIGNVNFLYEKTRPDEIVILLTTDVKMQPGTLSRVIAPLVNDDKIALSTPFARGGANLEAPESEVTTWRCLDTILGGCEPSYPDAETNVGYMLAIDRRKYPGTKLFDEFFVNGYGDDSDLYYRCLNLGLRGVVADNCCVFHEHGASFGTTEERTELQIENHRRFMERWGVVYQTRFEKADAKLQKQKDEQGRLTSILAQALPAPEIVFFLPTNNRNIGGVAAVFDLAEALCDSGLPTGVICRQNPSDETGWALQSIAFDDEQRCDATLQNAHVLLATSTDTVESVKQLAKKHELQTGYFIQGPEFSFEDGQNLTSVLTGYLGFDAIFVVSDYLKEVVKDHVDRPVTLIPYGPRAHKYHDLRTEREPRSVAVQLNGNPNKGSAFVAGVVAALAPKGFKIYSFGDETLRGQRKNLCTHLGFLSTPEKVKLFSKVEFYLDASNYEGLGLLLIESIRCGAIPIYRHNGGTADMLKTAGVGVEIGDYATISGIAGKLLDFRQEIDFSEERERCEKAVERHSLETAAAAMMEWYNAQR